MDKARMKFDYTPSLFGGDRLDDSADLPTARRFIPTRLLDTLFSVLRRG